MVSATSFQALRSRCVEGGQGHLLAHWENLSPAQQSHLLMQIESIDFTLLTELKQGAGYLPNATVFADRALPPDAVSLGQPYRGVSHREAVEEGNRAIAAGKVAMILVAGGQGTRLGFDKPKGMFPIGPVSRRTLFEMHVDSLRAAMQRFHVSIPLLIMTSPATDAATRDYFEEHQRLGLSPEDLFLFQQGTMPAIDAPSGRILMESPWELALSPDGHGGVVKALLQSGSMDAMRSRGIEYFFYAQVDNPMVRACDPGLIGYHRIAESQMTTQVVRKRSAKERVGNVVQIDGRTHIIEYSDLPDSLAEQTLPDGTLKLWAGNIAVHVFDRTFLETSASQSLPFHQALKTVPYVDADGNRHQPTSPNAIKYERFVFDLLPAAERTLVVEGDAFEVFAPVKNGDGAATDTPTTARQAISRLHASWLERAGATIQEEIQVEIHPMWAWDADEVLNKMQRPCTISADTYFV